jgi:hypothetical protein
MVAGLSNVITKGFLVTVNDQGFFALGTNELFGVKYSIWILIVAAFACGFVLSRTKFGRWLYAVGGNPEAARLSGIKVWAVLLFVYAFSGLMSGLGGVMSASRTATGQAGTGSTSSSGLRRVVVGGTSVMGGAARSHGAGHPLPRPHHQRLQSASGRAGLPVDHPGGDHPHRGGDRLALAPTDVTALAARLRRGRRRLGRLRRRAAAARRGRHGRARRGRRPGDQPGHPRPWTLA